LIFQVKIFDGSGNLKQIITAEELKKEFWRVRSVNRGRTKGAAVPGYGRIDYRKPKEK
jgi:hypothetical protein